MAKKSTLNRWTEADLRRAIRLYKEFSGRMDEPIGHSSVCRMVAGVMGLKALRVENGLMNHVEHGKLYDNDYLIAKEWQVSRAMGVNPGPNPLRAHGEDSEAVQELDVVTESSKHVEVHPQDFVNPEVFEVLENMGKYCEELEAKVAEHQDLAQQLADAQKLAIELNETLEQLENEKEALEKKVQSLKDREFEMTELLKKQQKKVEVDFLTKYKERFGLASHKS